jgi:hypothetical protein
MLRVLIGPMTAVLLAGAAFAARAPSPGACQTGRLMGVRAPLFAVATALEDTVLAGPGPIRYQAGDTTGLESIHGQRFLLEGLGGDVPAGVDGAGTEAVLVPYGWECGETWRWEKARWAEPGSQVFVDLSLRPRETWAGGLPTFDVEILHDVYPESYTIRLDSVPGDLLSPMQVFALNRVLPTFEQVRAAPDSAYGPLLAWARANPGLAARFPATAALEEAFEALQPCTAPSDPHPVAGTYRVTVVVERTDTLRTYFRTDARGYSACGAAPRMEAAMMRPRTADTTRLYVHGAADPDAIPETNGEAWNGTASCGVSNVDVVNRPRSEASRRAWQGDYNYLSLPGCFRDHPRVKQASDALFAAYRAGERDPQPGRFVEDADGGMRFEQVWRAGGRVVLELRAVRVSPRTLAGY